MQFIQDPNKLEEKEGYRNVYVFFSTVVFAM